MDNKGRPPINLGGRKVIEKWVRENPGEPVEEGGNVINDMPSNIVREMLLELSRNYGYTLGPLWKNGVNYLNNNYECDETPYIDGGIGQFRISYFLLKCWGKNHDTMGRVSNFSYF